MLLLYVYLIKQLLFNSTYLVLILNLISTHIRDSVLIISYINQVIYVGIIINDLCSIVYTEP